MNIVLIIFASGFLIIFISIFVLVIRQYRKTRSLLRNLAADLGEKELKSGLVYEGEKDGVKYFYQYIAGSRNSPSIFKLGLACPSRGEFRIAKESRFDSFFKRLGITVEIQTGEGEFDRDFFIQTDSVPFTRSYLMSPDKREAVRKLFALGYDRVNLDGQRMEAVISPFAQSEFKGGDFVEATLTELRRLTRDLPEEAAGYRALGVPVWKFRRGFIYAVSIAGVIAGAALLFVANKFWPPLDGGAMFLYSLHYIVPAYLLFLVVAVAFLKGRSSSHKDLLINLLIALIGFPISGYFGVMAANGYLDPAGGSDHEVLAMHKHVTRSRDRKHYHVTTETWRDSRTEEKIEVSYDTYYKIKPGSTALVVTTKPGRLGFEWLVSYRVRDR